MAWVPPNANAPNFDTGFVQLTQQAQVLAAAAIWLTGIWLVNTLGTEQHVTVTDNATGIIVSNMPLPPFSAQPLEAPFMPLGGLNAYSDVAAGVFIKAWGYNQ